MTTAIRPWDVLVIAGGTAGIVGAKTAAHGLTATDLASSTHPYPTYGDGVGNAAIEVVQERLAAPTVRRAMTVLVTARRGWATRPRRRNER